MAPRCCLLPQLAVLLLGCSSAAHTRAPPPAFLRGPPPGAENIFPVGMLGFSSFRAVVLVQSPTHLLAFTTGRHAGGDVSASKPVVIFNNKRVRVNHLKA